MICRKVRRYLFGYCKGELSSGQIEKIKDHLDSCPECAKEAMEIERINLLLKDDLETFVPSADFNEKLLAKIQTFPSGAEATYRMSWWQKLLHEVFPSVKLRWAMVGAASVIVVAFAAVLTQKSPDVAPEFLTEGGAGMESRASATSKDMIDSSYQDLMRRLARTSQISGGKTFVIDNFSFSTSRLEDGGIPPEGLYKKFVLDKRTPTSWQREGGSRYVLPVVSTQTVSQKKDY
jgi:hypothetical protein